MTSKKRRIILIILAVYLLACAALLFLGYRVKEPAVRKAEFPFSITYEYNGVHKTITDVYACSSYHTPKYLGENNLSWEGLMKGTAPGDYGFYRISETEDAMLALIPNFSPGYMMGDAEKAGEYTAEDFAPYGVYYVYSGFDVEEITDPDKLEDLGFRIIDWEYPAPIENTFHSGRIILSRECSVYLACITLAALLMCMLFVKKDASVRYNTLDHISFGLNLLIMILFLPMTLFVVIYGDSSFGSIEWLLLALYFMPSVTITGVAASLVFRRSGYRKEALFSQLAGPLVLIFVFVCRSILKI